LNILCSQLYIPMNPFPTSFRLKTLYEFLIFLTGATRFTRLNPSSSP
jgi:hypothetical protein